VLANRPRPLSPVPQLLFRPRGEGNSPWARARITLDRMGRGRPPHPDILTRAEWRVVNAVRHGLSNRKIARRLNISLDAVKFHVANAVSKLSLTDRTALKHWHGAPADSAVVKRGLMTKAAALGPIGQISRTVSDVPRAVAWYKDVLGLRHLYTFGNLAFFDCDGTRLFLSGPEQDAPVGNSVIYFRTADIEAEHKRLTAQGVSFRGAPHLIHRHDSGVEEWMAFFTDPDGGLLALMSQVAPDQRAS
jgi:catechol 2,3-dioxygenase-like lactoylglutathione lyase family enzyme/DNA-binding CsgD family transcriptional regulator